MAQWFSDLQKSGIRLDEFEALLQQCKKQILTDISLARKKATEGQKSEFLQLLTERFSEGEIQTLCFHLEVDYENLKGSGKENKARELIDLLDRRCRLAEFMPMIKKYRPDIFEASGSPSNDLVGRQDVIPDLTECFADGLALNSKDGALVLFLDDFEKPPAPLEKWLRTLVARMESCRILWVVASWGGLSGDWEQNMVKSHRLLPFSSDAVDASLTEKDRKGLDGFLAQFLIQAKVPEDALTPLNIGWAKRKTFGLPYMLNIASRYLRGEQTFERPSGALVRRIGEWIGNERFFQKVKRCAVARRHLDRDIARVLLEGDSGLTEFWNWLVSTPLLERTFSMDLEERTRVDPILRTAILRNIYGESRQDYIKLHSCMSEYYSQQIEARFPRRSFRRVCLQSENSLEWAFHLERYYHTLSVSPRDHRWLGVEMATLLLDADPSIFGRVYDIVRAFDCVITECGDETRWALGNWRIRLDQVAQILEDSESYLSEGLDSSNREQLKDFFEEIQNTKEIGIEVRTKAVEWSVTLGENSFD